MPNYNLVAPNLWSSSESLDHTVLEWLSELPMMSDATWSHPFYCLTNRLQLTGDQQVLDRIKKIGIDLTTNMEEVVNHHLEFSDFKVWLDLPGIKCPPHADDANILVTHQIYIKNYGEAVGTTFSHVTPPFEFKFEPNTGYVNLNSDLKIHHVRSELGARLSIAFQWLQNQNAC